jgi:hypothetical protein
MVWHKLRNRARIGGGALVLGRRPFSEGWPESNYRTGHGLSDKTRINSSAAAGQCVVYPPSTTSWVPVTYEDSSLARNSAA